jgi:UDP-2,3-diacylglucosamine hydrolase
LSVIVRDRVEQGRDGERQNARAAMQEEERQCAQREPVGLLAGNGRFPLLFARTAKAEGARVVAVAHEGETDPALADHVEAITWIRVGQLEPVVRAFRSHGVRRAVMAGGIHKAALMTGFAPDERGARVLSRLRAWSDDAVLREVAVELENEGIAVVDSTLFLSSILTPPGRLAGPEIDAAQQRDIEYGLRVARGIGRYDVGQTVVVKSGVVLAVEAIEGTDEALKRGGRLARGGAVAVKVSKPGQDLRFDVPAVGPTTVETCREAGIAVLALEAGRTLLLEKERFLSAADAAGLAVTGVGEEKGA